MNANDIPAGLKELAERRGLLGVIVVVQPEGRPLEVWSFGEVFEEGADVDEALDDAKDVIRKRT
jgi:hypothetical protein